MFDLSRREKKLINICIYMLIFILYYNFYLSYVLRDGCGIYKNIKKYNLKIQNISSIKEKQEKTNKNFNMVSNIKHEDISSSSIASTLKIIADSSKIQIKELAFDNISEDKPLDDKFKVGGILVKAYAVGDYSNVIAFIEKVNKQKLCSINNAIIKRQNSNIQLNIDISYYDITYKEDDKYATKK